MENFKFSELYQKYFIRIILDKKDFYTVWGTDLIDDETDKLLIENKKLILFESMDSFKNQVNNYPDVFMDRENFANWINDESFKHVYNSNNLSHLFEISADDLFNKKRSLEIIDSINLLQDFYKQINELKELFASKPISNLWDYLYNTHFWKKEIQQDGQVTIKDINITEIRDSLFLLKTDFQRRIQFV